jgi:hypothetical protein
MKILYFRFAIAAHLRNSGLSAVDETTHTPEQTS